MINKIVHANCMGFLDKIDDNYFDITITDPPYGIGINNMGFVKSGDTRVGVAYRNDYREHETEWDKHSLTMKQFKEIQRVSKNQVIFGANNFANILPNSRCWIVWDKRVDEKYNNDFSDCELIWTSFDKPSRIIRFLWSGMLQNNMKNKEKRYHPSQKPVFVMKKIIEMFTKEGDNVLDPFMGVGSTCIGCKQLGRNYTGVEINKKYVDIANKRLDKTKYIPISNEVYTQRGLRI